MATRKNSKKLYTSVNQITFQEIENIYCLGSTLAAMPKYEEPYFIWKWGPPGSGKSSELMEKKIASFGFPLINYVNISKDRLVEYLLPYRKDTLVAKIEDLRYKALHELQQNAPVKEWIAKYKRGATEGDKFSNGIPEFKKMKNDIYIPGRSEATGVLQGDEWKDEEKVQSVFSQILFNRLTKSYYDSITLKNSSGRTINDKINLFLRKCMDSRVHIISETIGDDYGRGEAKPLNLRGKTRQATKLQDRSLLQIFANGWENRFGRIIYNESGEPVRVEQSPLDKNNEYIPDYYTIVIIYPVLPTEKIIDRVKKRSKAMLFDTERQYDNIDELAEDLETYASEIHRALFGGVIPRIEEYKNKINELINGEFGVNNFTGFIGEKETPKGIPYYRTIAAEKIYKMIEESFYYSMDYILRQYVYVGRIKEIVYLNTEEHSREKRYASASEDEQSAMWNRLVNLQGSAAGIAGQNYDAYKQEKNTSQASRNKVYSEEVARLAKEQEVTKATAEIRRKMAQEAVLTARAKFEKERERIKAQRNALAIRKADSAAISALNSKDAALVESQGIPVTVPTPPKTKKTVTQGKPTPAPQIETVAPRFEMRAASPPPGSEE